MQVGWGVVRLLLLLAFVAGAVLSVAVLVGSVARAEEPDGFGGQPRYSLYSDSMPWYDSYGRMRYGPRGLPEQTYDWEQRRRAEERYGNGSGQRNGGGGGDEHDLRGGGGTGRED
jgi:hypothetical protein